jgi:hypothetical protein
VARRLQLALEYDVPRNRGVRLMQAMLRPGSKVWWCCPADPDHAWRASISQRLTDPASGCPVCARRIVPPSRSLAARFPDVAAQWHPTRNGTLRPDGVTAGIDRLVWWKCALGTDHEWQATLQTRTRPREPTGCPFCAGQRLSVTNSLATRFPEIAAQWHPTKNGTLTPAQVVGRTGRRVWWQCPNGPDHEWEATIDNRQHGGCPFCRGLRVSVTNSLATRFPTVAAEWHPAKNGELTPDQVVAGSGRKVWWRCRTDPEHEWQATLNARTCPGRMTGCPYCAGVKVMITNHFRSRFYELAEEYHQLKNRGLTLEQVARRPRTKVWWQCSHQPEHTWRATVLSRARRLEPERCPLCAEDQRARPTASVPW